MIWLKKKNDPISERRRELQAQIERLEQQIQQLNAQLERPRPRFRSTALAGAAASGRVSPPRPAEQIFEAVDQQRLQATPEAIAEAHFNELGVRKYDLVAAWRKLKTLFRGSTPSNPQFVALLAAGQVQGLRHLRYEKRIARRRFIVLTIALLIVLWGVLVNYLRQ